MNFASFWLALLISLLLLGNSFNANSISLLGYTQNANIPELEYAFTAVHDRQGYIWFGNRTGLHKYDGYNIHTYSVTGSANHTNVQVRSLFIDDNQIMWIGTTAGLNRYDPSKQTLELIDSTYWPGAVNIDISAMHMDNNGILWIASLNFGLFQYDSKNNRFRAMHLDAFEIVPNSEVQMWDIKIDANNKLWVATSDGVYHLSYDHQSQQITQVEKFTTQNSKLLSDLVIKLHLDSHQNLWIGTSKGLNYYHALTQSITPAIRVNSETPQLTQVNITSFAVDEQDRLWISTWGKGVSIIDKIQQNKLNQQQGFRLDSPIEIDTFVYNDYPTDDIQSNDIYQILSDRSGRIWIIGSNNIKVVRSDALAVDHYKFMPNFPGDIPDDSIIDDTRNIPRQLIKYIFEDSFNNQWLAGSNGLSRFNPSDNSLTYLFYQRSTSNKLSVSHCVTLFEDSLNKIWIGNQTGLSVYDPVSNELNRDVFKQQSHNELNYTHADSVESCTIQSITEDKNNNIWLSSEYQLIKYNQLSREFERFTLPKHKKNVDHNHKIVTFEYDGDNTLWIAREHEDIGKFDLTTLQYQRYSTLEGAPKAKINDIAVSDKSTIWIVTDNGLWLFDGDSNFTHFTQAASQTSTFKSLAFDKDNNLWIGTNEGLKYFNTTTEKFIDFDTSMGLMNDEYIVRATFEARDGKLYFAGTKGIDHFDPLILLSNYNEQRNKVVLTDFILENESASINTPLSGSIRKKDNQFRLNKAIDYLSTLTLDHTHKLFKFEFSTFDYLHLNQTRYAFRLKGFQDNWLQTDSNNRQATFINVPAGNYQFEVKATKYSDQWSDIKSIKIEILPPWWQSKIAYGFYLLTFIAILWLSYRWRTASIIARSHALERQVQERTATISKLMAQKDQMFANISHEFRTPLTLILNPADKLIKSTKINQNELAKAATGIKQNAQRLLRMVEQLLEFARTEHSHQQSGLQNYALSHTVNYLLACFDSLFNSKQLRVSINEFEDVQLRLKPDSLEIILSNLISNAVKYTPENGIISIHIKQHVEQQKNVVTIAIKDNGIGIAPEHQKLVFERFGRVAQHQADTQASTGIGLALVKELVTANGGQIELQSELDKGSCFTITLPIATQSESQQYDNQISDETSNNSKQITALEISNLANITEKSTNKANQQASQQNSQADTNQTPDNKTQILVIDDNLELLELIKGIISPHYHCLTAQNGEQGLKLAQEQLPDLVISDLMMPGISGFEVLKTLKSDALTAHIPVIMLTAKGDAQSRIEGWNNKADEYLAKPFSDDELIARIGNILAIRKIISNRYQQQFAQGTTQALTQPPVTEKPPAQELDLVAEKFSQKITQILEEHFQNNELSVATIANHMAMSQRQLVRKTKAILSMTPNECIRTYRLNKSAELLTTGLTPSTIAYEVGFTSHSYFAACFKAHFGCTPSEYIKT